MNYKQYQHRIEKAAIACLLIVIVGISYLTECRGQNTDPVLQYTVSMPEPSDHLFHIVLDCKNLKKDTVDLKMPQWMPGYYQIMNYSRLVRNFTAINLEGRETTVERINNNTWRIIPGKNNSLRISYDVYSDRKFVASNYLDSTRGYIVPAATFMFINEHTDIPVIIKVVPFNSWNNIATGLAAIEGKSGEFIAPDFDILYDCPILVGKLEELPSFNISGIKHRFIAYNPGIFNRTEFITALEKTVKAGIDLFGEIPYKEYTFIGIGPGAGGIEHLNNTTVSFSGMGLDKPGAMERIMKFLAHEYFHHYNVKRIRPFELGPFDYDKENRTNLLWFSEGVTVYYEYLIVRRAGLITDEELIKSIESEINTFENDPGRRYQSLSQASYNTWSDGPFGNRPGEEDKLISYYNKGCLAGMILDFAIRNATGNKKSLDNVMRLLYEEYYKKVQRGFTDAELQDACEEVAGISLSPEFEYVYTTKDIEYSKYLSYAGLKITEDKDTSTGRRKFTITRQDNLNSLQLSIFQSWSGGSGI